MPRITAVDRSAIRDGDRRLNRVVPSRSFQILLTRENCVPGTGLDPEPAVDDRSVPLAPVGPDCVRIAPFVSEYRDTVPCDRDPVPTGAARPITADSAQWGSITDPRDVVPLSIIIGGAEVRPVVATSAVRESSRGSGPRTLP